MIPAMSDAQTVLERCELLAACTEEPGRITRRFATPALARARDLVAGWMRDSGLEPRTDAVGNLLGRRPGPGPTLLLGSHLDSVRDAGRYDGVLGVAIALTVAERTMRRALPFALEVAAFADEEGVRFGTAFLGSAVLAGRADPQWLARQDRDGITLREALTSSGGDPAGIAAPPRDDLLAYLEVHIEQGPVLVELDRSIAVVEAIGGQSHARVTFTGSAGHAGTTQMGSRRDALAAAADWIGTVELTGRLTEGLVATVGEIEVAPGAANVIAGRAEVSLDVRHFDDATRTAAVARLRDEAARAGAARGVAVDWHDGPGTETVPCDPKLTALLARAARIEAGTAVPSLASGAGHDAVMLANVAPIAMLFVRCAGGISHHPAESVSPSDVAVALDVTTRVVEELAHAGV
jgi:allantoate deiminase